MIKESKVLNMEVNPRWITIAEIFIIVSFALVPLFSTYPFRINIFLSWEGAYRMYLGQMPYKDFGIPLGYGYWLVPALFFKIFGPYLATLVKAQVFLNVVSGLSFRSILNSLKVSPPIRFLSVFLFVISFSFHNFWPWYNHTVIVYELMGLALILVAFKEENGWRFYFLGFSAAFFLLLSFLTKQDGGFFAIVIGGGLALAESLIQRSYKYVAVFAGGLCISVLILIAPFVPHDFLYWFNYGQPPHYGRTNLMDIANEFFEKSIFLKFYLFLFILIILSKLKKWRELFSDCHDVNFIILSFGILVQAIVLQVTSYTPLDGNIYFHAFSIAFILSNINWNINFWKFSVLAPAIVFIFIWWSGTYWKYTTRILKRISPELFTSDKSSDNIISINTYKLEFDSTALDQSTWILSEYKAFDRVYMPRETVEGMRRLQQLPVFQGERKPKVLNMSELTPLAHELGYELETKLPLWYHLNVGMFQRELDLFLNRIDNQYYDVVLFEIIPNLNNFYPEAVREALQDKYDRIDVFQAPRRNTSEVIEVYVPKVIETE
jgi:hypothetical protein